jgi:hypothetical protein
MPVAVMEQFAFLHNVTGQPIPMRGEGECCIYFTSWDLGKRMEGDVIESHTKSVHDILDQSAPSKRSGSAVRTAEEGTPYTSTCISQDLEQHVHDSAIKLTSEMK